MSRRFPSVHAQRALAVTLLIGWTMACTAYRPIRSDRRLTSGRLRIQASAPMELTAPTTSLSVMSLCRVTFLDADLERVAGDTLVFQHVNRATVASRSEGQDQNQRCPRLDGIITTLVRTADMEITELRFNRGQTTALVLGILVLAVAFAAFGASQIETGFPQR